MHANFQCSICEKRFLRNGDLVRHKKIHAGVRPFPCSYCGKRFAQSYGLKTHLNTHTGNKPHVCGINSCRATFGDPSSRSRHEKEVHNPLHCHTCPVGGCHSTIKRRSAFVKHLKERHGLRHDEIDAVVGTTRRASVVHRVPKAPQPSTTQPLPAALPPISELFQGAQAINGLIGPQFWNDFNWQGLTDKSANPLPLPENSALFAGIALQDPEETFRQLYELSTSPCATPPPLSNSPSSTSPSSAGIDYLQTPPNLPAPYSSPIVAVDPLNFSLHPPLLARTNQPTQYFSDNEINDLGHYFTASRPKYPPSAALALSPLIQFNSFAQLPYEPFFGHEEDPSLF